MSNDTLAILSLILSILVFDSLALSEVLRHGPFQITPFRSSFCNTSRQYIFCCCVMTYKKRLRRECNHGPKIDLEQCAVNIYLHTYKPISILSRRETGQLSSRSRK
ncbi:hypothetical protein V8F33_004828 [Rhypophila sp. PSN 637]